uniref:Uncharacterized protein n=1 Tax=Anguilla anguilla TaxID=7936 RepID=A0A0E9SI06_ANGAN
MSKAGMTEVMDFSLYYIFIELELCSQ